MYRSRTHDRRIVLPLESGESPNYTGRRSSLISGARLFSVSVALAVKIDFSSCARLMRSLAMPIKISIGRKVWCAKHFRFVKFD
jgi:hypothetical protein